MIRSLQEVWNENTGAIESEDELRAIVRQLVAKGLVRGREDVPDVVSYELTDAGRGIVGCE